MRTDTHLGADTADTDVAWTDLVDPSETEFRDAGAANRLHPLAIADARRGHQRAKYERHGDTGLVVLRPARYRPGADEVEFGELHVLLRSAAVVTTHRPDRPDRSALRRRWASEPDELRRGPLGVVLAVVGDVVDGYRPVVVALEEAIDRIDDDLADGVVEPGTARSIHELMRQVIGFQRAVGPLPEVVAAVLAGSPPWGPDDAVRLRLRALADHAHRIADRADSFRAALERALALHATLVTQEQNDAMRRMTSASLAQGEESRRLARATMEQGEEVKKISSWAAILFAPTLVASIYGMNFRHMPELAWRWGYPFSIALMIAFGVVLWIVFRRRRWL